MVVKIGFDHLLGHLAGRGAKVASGPKKPAPVALLHAWKLLEQSDRGLPFDAPHDLTGRQAPRPTRGRGLC